MPQSKGICEIAYFDCQGGGQITVPQPLAQSVAELAVDVSTFESRPDDAGSPALPGAGVRTSRRKAPVARGNGTRRKASAVPGRSR